jgi:hypothetical protein
MGKWEDVIKLLEYLVANCKPESRVYFLLGKTYQRLGKIKEAICMMTMAQDYMEHKSSSIIKDAVEKLFKEDESSLEDELIL